ncbi:MAG: hypothetical protein NZM09_06415 [Ignavibacterium sp.]|nr:hypothetical protein [Ignavibacterium sp.]MDW8375314.1 hypothetical protein [Ignavibacteriales bacterium]
MLALLLFLIFSTLTFSQNLRKEIGIISFRSSQNLYAKFNSTEKININDTIYLSSNNTAVGIVKFKSLNSISASIINSIEVDDSVFVILNEPINMIPDIKDDLIKKDSVEKSFTTLFDSNISSKENTKLRFSFQSYGYVNNYKEQSRQKIKTSFLDKNFFDENLSFELNFNYYINNYSSSNKDRLKDNLRIFQIQLDYQLDDGINLLFGRSFNPVIKSLDVIDGFQIIRTTNNQSFGLIFGSRPNLRDYWFNVHLIQIGLFYNRIDSINSNSIQNSIGFVEQTNNFKSDRRFVFIEHSNNLIPSTTAFFMSEIDFFNLTNLGIKEQLNITSLYTGFNIRVIKHLNFNLSFDSRKNFFYLNEYRNQIDSLINYNFRNGIKIFSSYSPINGLRLSAFYYQSKIKNERKSSSNIGASIFYYSDFLFNSSFSVSLNNYKTNFINGNNFSFTISREFSEIGNLSLTYKNYEFNSSTNRFLSSYQSLELGCSLNLSRSYNLYSTFEKNFINKIYNYFSFDISYRL